MFTLKHTDETFNGQLFGVPFVDGRAVTNNADVVRFFRRRADRGFTVQPIGDEVPLETDTLPSRADLVESAEALGITVPTRATKAEIAELIALAQP